MRLSCLYADANNEAKQVFNSLFGPKVKTALATRDSADAARLALFECIEVFCNCQRLHLALGYKSPTTCEQQHQVA